MTSSATVLGGLGGAGGETRSPNFNGGNGGDGGTGILFMESGVTFTNLGRVTGGAGGTGGVQGTVGGNGVDGSAGLGGAGIVGNGITLINGGVITGGLSGDRTIQADAVTFAGGANVIKFQNATSGLDGSIGVLGEGTTLTFSQSTDVALSNVIHGTGSLIKSGANTLDYTGHSSDFAGSTTINDGLLSVNGQLGGTMTVASGGRLGGTGTIGSGIGSSVTVASGGTLAPGNSIGTLTVNGNLIFNAGSHYAVEVDPSGAASDRVHVTGSATLDGGAVAHIGAAGNYKLGSSYTILSADTALVGRFGSVTSDFAFLTPSLSYDYLALTVALDLKRNDVSFASLAASRNQIAVAGGVDSIGGGAGNPVYAAVALLPGDKHLIQAAFDALSGEIHASARTVLIENSRFIRDAINGRIRGAFSAVGASEIPILSFGETANDTITTAAIGRAPASIDRGRFAVWGSAFGSWGSTDGNGNAAGLDRSSGGFVTGLDGLVAETVRLGITAGYSHDRFSAGASSGASDNYHLGLYGGTQFGALGFRSGVTYTWHDVATRRASAFPGFADSLTAGYDAHTIQAFGEFGYRIDTAVASFEPFANLAYVNLRGGGFAETGGAAALTGNGQITDTTFTTLGVRASTDFDIGPIKVTARDMLGWRHALGDTVPTATHAFAGSNAFTVAGAPIARDAAVVETGIDMKLAPNARFGVSYTGQLSGQARDHGFTAKMAIRF
jgi:outer membrane autotransporter protein